MNNREFIKYLFENIIAGNGSVIISSNTERLNNIALEIYNINELSNDEIDELKEIIMICNILYNRTDLDILPINDSFYDLLLEKYKKYDNNFQVGSAVVEIKNLISTRIENPIVIKKSPFIIHKEIKRNEIHQEIYDEIIRKGKPILNIHDFDENNPLYNESISKRMHNTAHNHPSLVGTLDKCKFVLIQDAINAGCIDDPNVKILERDFFNSHIEKGIINPNHISVVCELKYDGVSVEADCTDQIISARTRGDTGAGVAADITPLLGGYKFKQATSIITNPIGVKFEAIITKSNLERFNREREESYKNCRTAIVGLFGSSDGYKYRDLITLVPLAIDRDDIPEISNRIEEIEFINRLFRSHGEPLRYCYFEGDLATVLYYIKAFWDEAMYARDILNFMYDGIVVSYIDENIRNKLGRTNFINKYSMAVKFDPIEKQTIFNGYTYEVGQNGQVTPMIHYNPVEFLGTIHTKSTGSSYERFNKLGLRYGDIINVTYRNDVMPYVSKAECEANRNNTNPVIEFISHCPICGSELVLSDSNKTVYCPNMECPARSISRMTNMMAKLNLKGFAEATFKALPEIDHLYKLFDYNEDFYISRLGNVDGHNLYMYITNNLYNIQDFVLIGSLGFSGIARKKWESILNKISVNDIYYMYKNSNSINEFELLLNNNISGIGPVTAHTIANEFPFFEKDIEKSLSLNMKQSFGLINKTKAIIRFTGCRNLQLATQLNKLGYDCDSDGSVTKATNILLIPYEGFTSNKTSKASANCLIIPITEFEKDMNRYLSQFENS